MNKANWKDVEFKVGDTIKFDYTIKDNDKDKDKERTQAYQGIVIAIKGQGEGKMFTVRKVAVDRIGMERIIPTNSPWIANLKVMGKPKKKMRRSKLYYLRDREGKKAKI